MHPYARVLQVYMDALGRSDYATVKGLFAPHAKVLSWVSPRNVETSP
jgi:hypothetical protein